MFGSTCGRRPPEPCVLAKAGTDGRTLQRLELALGALGLTAAALVLVVAVDAVQFHAAAMWWSVSHLSPRGLEAHGLALLVIGAADCAVILRAARSLVRQARAHRAFLRRLPVCAVLELHGQRVRVFPGRPLAAFCGGLLRPEVYVSAGTLRKATRAELRAILAHEAHHRARRDPLRLLLARTVSDAFRPLPPLASLADRHLRLADLAADAAAVRALGDPRPLASALARFEETAGVAPERVDQLMRRTPPEAVPSWVLVAVGLALGGSASLTGLMLLGGWHPDPVLPLAAMAAAFAPAGVAAHRADAWLRPSA